MGKGNKFKQDAVDGVDGDATLDAGAETPETAEPTDEVGQTAKERLFDALTPKGQKGPPTLDEKYLGEKCYQLTERHYRDGRMFEAGECVRVKDEKPGNTWRPIKYDERYEMITREKPVDIDAVTGKAVAPTPVYIGEPELRASDRDV